MIHCPNCKQTSSINLKNTIFSIMVCCGVYQSIIGINQDDIPEKNYQYVSTISNSVVASGATTSILNSI